MSGKKEMETPKVPEVPTTEQKEEKDQPSGFVLMDQFIKDLDKSELKYDGIHRVQAPRWPVPLYNYVFVIAGPRAEQLNDIEKQCPELFDLIAADLAIVETIGIRKVTNKKVEITYGYSDRYGVLEEKKDEEPFKEETQKIVWDFLRTTLKTVRGIALANELKGKRG